MRKNNKQLMIDIIKKKLSKLPHSPWVYKMLSESWDVIYVWKAKDLQKRVSSYFQNKDHPIRTQKLVENTKDLDWIEVNSELEALLLETNIIKQLSPKYNILMKDWKYFCYLKITLADKFPRIDIARQLKKDGSKYYWPKTSSKLLYSTIKILQEVFPIVSNNIYRIDWYPKKIDYQKAIDDLPWVDNEKYLEAINAVMDFFEWKHEKINDALKEKMLKYAKNKQFEAAAKIRDYLNEFNKIIETQIVCEPRDTFQDIFWFMQVNEKTYATLFQLRNWKIIANENFSFNWVWSDKEIQEALITQYYAHTADFPKEILLPKEMWDSSILEKWIEENIDKKIKVTTPVKWKKSKLVDLAIKNAENFANIKEEKESKDKEKIKTAFKQIFEVLFWDKIEEKKEHKNNEQLDINLTNSHVWNDTNKPSRHVKSSKYFKRMECYDISHFWWDNQVGSMSVFTDWIPNKKEYRHFNIKTLVTWEIDDFKAMYEVISRRTKSIDESFEDEIWKTKFSYEKLNAKKIQEIFQKETTLFQADFDPFKKEEKRNLILYLVKYWLEIIWLIHAFKYDSSLFEIDFQNSIFLSHKNIKNKEEIIEDFLIKSHEIFQDKSVWIYAEWKEENRYVNLWYKKLKTIKWELNKDKWLVPEVIACFCKEEKWIYLNKKFEKRKSKSPIPSLVLIDWWKGQLSSALKAFEDNDWKKGIDSIFIEKRFGGKSYQIILISIAKKQEEVFCINNKNPIKLKNDSQWSFMLQRLRDESHRFAIEHQKKKRDAKTKSSEIDNIPWIWNVTKFKLLKNFGSFKAILEAKNEDLLKFVNKGILSAIREYENR